MARRTYLSGAQSTGQAFDLLGSCYPISSYWCMSSGLAEPAPWVKSGMLAMTHLGVMPQQIRHLSMALDEDEA